MTELERYKLAYHLLAWNQDGDAEDVHEIAKAVVNGEYINLDNYAPATAAEVRRIMDKEKQQ